MSARETCLNPRLKKIRAAIGRWFPDDTGADYYDDLASMIDAALTIAEEPEPKP